MPTEVTMPQMGESIAEGTLTRWFKKPGEAVKRDEPLFEISTDKVDAEIPSPADGVLTEIRVDEGTTVEVNTVVALLGEGDGAPPSSSEPTTTAEVDEKPAEPAPAKDAAPKASREPHARPADSDDGSGGNGTKVRSSPLVRRIAREHGISDISVIPGTGLSGRVTKTDILSYIDTKEAGAARPSKGPAAAPAEALPILNLPRNHVDVEPMTIMRKKIAEHMVHSRRVSAHVNSVFEADMTQIVRLREGSKKSFEARNGVKLTYMPFFVKAVCSALREYPYVNASLDGDEILMHRTVNMGIAVALDGGLIVPVIRGADELNVVGLQKRVTDLANRARSKALLPDEVSGGTFTITNPGQYGGLFGIPIINQPQVAILGIGGIKKRPVVVEGDAIAVRSMVYLCLSYDHRLVDGALADQFMAQLVKNLEEWTSGVD